jgi:hypothetical protein
MGAEDEIGYAGPDLTYKPGIGGNQPTGTKVFLTPSQRSYADIDLLSYQLQLLLSEAKLLAKVLEDDLLRFVMPIPRGDTRLVEANKLEWPTGLGDPRNTISYRFYRALGTRVSASSSYIRQRFEEAVRDYTGTDSLDILGLINFIVLEAEMVIEFLGTYVGDVDDTSEMRTVELFLDWTGGARQRLVELASLHNRLVPLPENEVEPITAREARNAQASFKVQLNAVNMEVETATEFLRRNFSEHAATFYARYLGPALQFRLAVTRRIQATTGELGRTTNQTNEIIDDRLAKAHADQLRRNLMFDAKMQEAASKISNQNIYRNYIQQLAPIGRELIPGVPGTVMEAEQDPEEVEFFVNEPILPPPSPFKASHSALADLADELAHEQYYLKGGDTLTGDLLLEAGIRIDGIIPHLHRHTGEDGTEKILGTDIAGGTVSPDVIDRTVIPAQPTELRLISTTQRVVPPGVTVIDVLIGWTGDAALTYEVQLAPIG